MAGGGVKGGQAIGATDELGFRAVEKKFHVHDLHATMLALLGLDHERLTYRFEGRDRRLTRRIWQCFERSDFVITHTNVSLKAIVLCSFAIWGASLASAQGVISPFVERVDAQPLLLITKRLRGHAIDRSSVDEGANRNAQHVKKRAQ